MSWWPIYKKLLLQQQRPLSCYDRPLCTVESVGSSSSSECYTGTALPCRSVRGPEVLHSTSTYYFRQSRLHSCCRDGQRYFFGLFSSALFSRQSLYVHRSNSSDIAHPPFVRLYVRQLLCMYVCMLHVYYILNWSRDGPM